MKFTYFAQIILELGMISLIGGASQISIDKFTLCHHYQLYIIIHVSQKRCIIPCICKQEFGTRKFMSEKTYVLMKTGCERQSTSFSSTNHALLNGMYPLGLICMWRSSSTKLPKFTIQSPLHCSSCVKRANIKLYNLFRDSKKMFGTFHHCLKLSKA